MVLAVVVQLLNRVQLFVTPWTGAARLPCPSPSPRVCSDSYPLSHDAIQWSRPLLLLPSIFPSIRVFSNELALHIRWPKYGSFSISPSKEYSRLISFRMDWLDLLAVQGTLKESSPTPQFKSTNSLALSLLYGPSVTFIHDYWKNCSFWLDGPLSAK